jgi:hypothetical protein
MAKDPVDIHEGEPPITTPLGGETLSELESVKASLGPLAISRFSALAEALEILSNGIVAVMNDRAEQKKKLPDRTINNVIGGILTEDTKKVQRAAAIAVNARSPQTMNDFVSSRIDQVSDRMDEEGAELADLLAIVNEFKKQVESS